MTRVQRVKQRMLTFASRGGARRGAGRKPVGERACVSHKKREKFLDRLPVHVTLRLADGLRSLRRGPTHYVLRQVIAAGAERDGFRVVHYSAMRNHIHLLCEADNHVRLARGVQGLKVRIARRLNQWWGRRGKVFADRFHSHVLHTPTEVRNALMYVLKNAHHHKLLLPGQLDPFSSAAWFDGWKGIEPKSNALLPIARTRLMTDGWRKRGLLDPDGVPASRTRSRPLLRRRA